MKKLVFLLGVMDKHAGMTGFEVSQADFDMINRIAVALNVQVQIMVAIPDRMLAGKAQKVRMSDIRAHRTKVLTNILACEPDVVVACGTVALKCLMNKGNVTTEKYARQDLAIPELPDALCVVTHSMELVAAKPGTEKHLLLDVFAALHGRLETEWGDYTILQPGTPEWNVMPEELVGADKIGLDLETFPGLDPWHPEARIRMAVVSRKLGSAYVVQARRDSSFPEWLVRLAGDSTVQCGGSNIKFDYRWMHRFGYLITSMFDTSTAEHTIDSSSSLTDLKSLTFLYAPKLSDYSRGHRQLVAERGGWEHVEDHEMYQYCGADGEASVATMLEQTAIMEKEGLIRPFQLSMELYQVLADMETRGVHIDMDAHNVLAKQFVKVLGTQSDLLMQTLGPINLNSHQQLAKALRAAVPDIRLTDAKLTRQFAETQYKLHAQEDPEQYSTDKAILEREAHRHPVIGQLLLYRRLAKLHGTYVTGLREKHVVQHPDGLWYVHTSYRTDRVETGRLASQGPNMQNMPRKPEPGDKYPIPPELNIKRQFVSRFPGGSIMEADAGQAEIRIAAHESKDRALLAALTSGLDVHTAMCAQFHSKPASQVTPLERTHGKRQTFLVLYGGGANTLSEQLGIPKHVAKEMLDQFFRTYPELDAYIKQTKLLVKRDLYSESMFGYRRRFRKPTRWDSPEGWHIERQAWNHKVQNAAAVVTFVAMLDLQRMMSEAHVQSQIVMQVHDSIVVDCYPGEEQLMAQLMRTALEHPQLERWGVNLIVPLVTDIEIGSSWGDKKKFVDAA